MNDNQQQPAKAAAVGSAAPTKKLTLQETIERMWFREISEAFGCPHLMAPRLKRGQSTLVDFQKTIQFLKEQGFIIESEST